MINNSFFLLLNICSLLDLYLVSFKFLEKSRKTKEEKKKQKTEKKTEQQNNKFKQNIQDVK